MWWFIGFVMGAVVDMAVGMGVMHWHFKNGFWQISSDPLKRLEYEQRFPFVVRKTGD